MRLSRTEINCICKEIISKLRENRKVVIKNAKSKVKIPEEVQNLLQFQKKVVSINDKIRQLDKQRIQLIDEMYDISNNISIPFNRYDIIGKYDFIELYLNLNMPKIPTEEELTHQITLKNLSKDFDIEKFINDLVEKYEVLSI